MIIPNLNLFGTLKNKINKDGLIKIIKTLKCMSLNKDITLITKQKNTFKGSIKLKQIFIVRILLIF